MSNNTMSLYQNTVEDENIQSIVRIAKALVADDKGLLEKINDAINNKV